MTALETFKAVIENIDIESKYFPLLGLDTNEDVVFKKIHIEWNVDIDFSSKGIKMICPHVPNQEVVITGTRDDEEFEIKVPLTNINAQISDNDRIGSAFVSLYPNSFEIYEDDCTVYFSL